MKFAQKLTLAMVVLLCAVMSFGGAWTIEQNLAYALDRVEREYTATHLQERIVLERMMREEELSGISGVAMAAERYTRQFQSAIGTRQTQVSILTGDGSFVYSYMPKTVRFEHQISAIQVGESGLFYSRGKDSDYLLLASSLQSPIPDLWLVSAFDIHSLYQERDRQLTQYLWLEGAVLSFAGAAAWVLSRILTAPLRSLEHAAHKIADGQYDQRVKSSAGQDEVALLGRSFNTMADAVQDNMLALEEEAARQKRFVQALTHEIKTPMTTILGYSDLLRLGEQPPARRQQAADSIYHEAARLEKLSKQLLQMFGLEKEETQLQPVKVSSVFGDVRRSLGESFPLQLEVRCDPAAVVAGNRLLLADLCLNLVRNAAHAEPKDGKVVLACDRCSVGWALTVTDRGRGIPPEDLPRLTEPFYMVDKSRARKAGGSGLGLNLCAEIARQHGSVLEFESTLGEGTCVRLVLREEKSDEER